MFPDNMVNNRGGHIRFDQNINLVSNFSRILPPGCFVYNDADSDRDEYNSRPDRYGPKPPGSIDTSQKF